MVILKYFFVNDKVYSRGNPARYDNPGADENGGSMDRGVAHRAELC